MRNVSVTRPAGYIARTAARASLAKAAAWSRNSAGVLNE